MLKRISWTYQGNRYTIDWVVVSVFTLVIMAVMLADKLKKPYDFFVAVGLLAAGITWVIVMLAKAKRAEVVEKIRYNLTINIQCYKKTFEKTLLHSAEDEIEEYGLAIHRAKKYLQGNWRVTEKGRLVRGFAQDVESYTAIMDIDDVTPGLALLEKVLAGKSQMKENSSIVHLHFIESGSVVNVGVNENGLYLN
ncbi:MAG: hypothetical protein US70_C0036G0006 [Parcubacteria group bacterium GW2011_GWD2_38_11]|nr:MAG: hypothetical protein US70_C0036G0006 [Parcubacteria group bacterium GW2011_GWD2_38_11]